MGGGNRCCLHNMFYLPFLLCLVHVHVPGGLAITWQLLVMLRLGQALRRAPLACQDAGSVDPGRRVMSIPHVSGCKAADFVFCWGPCTLRVQGTRVVSTV